MKNRNLGTDCDVALNFVSIQTLDRSTHFDFFSKGNV